MRRTGEPPVDRPAKRLARGAPPSLFLVMPCVVDRDLERLIEERDLTPFGADLTPFGADLTLFGADLTPFGGRLNALWG